MQIVRPALGILAIVLLVTVSWAEAAAPAKAPAKTPAAGQATAAAAAEWPSFRGGEHDGKSPDTGLLKEWPAEGPPLLWKAEGIGAGFSSVAVSGGKIYTSGDVGGKLTIFAFDMEGKNLWTVEHDQAWGGDHQGSRSTPTIDSGKLYILSGQGLLGCYDAATGNKIWTRSMKEFGGAPGGWGYSESALVHGNAVFVTPGGKNCIVALNKTTGQPIWASTGVEMPAGYGSSIWITYRNVPMIVQGTGGGITGVDARTGAALFTNTWCQGNTANCPNPAYEDGYVFWANGYGKGGICLKLGATGTRLTAEQAWTSREFDCHHGGYIIDNGYIYGNAGRGLACLDLKTGQKKWSAQGVGKGSVIWADGMLYLFSENGGTAGLGTCSPDAFQLKGRFQVKGNGPSWAHPAVIGGRLYLRYDQNLYCFDVKAK